MERRPFYDGYQGITTLGSRINLVLRLLISVIFLQGLRTFINIWNNSGFFWATSILGWATFIQGATFIVFAKCSRATFIPASTFILDPRVRIRNWILIMVGQLQARASTFFQNKALTKLYSFFAVGSWFKLKRTTILSHLNKFLFLLVLSGL